MLVILCQIQSMIDGNSSKIDELTTVISMMSDDISKVVTCKLVNTLYSRSLKQTHKNEMK